MVREGWHLPEPHVLNLVLPFAWPQSTAAGCRTACRTCGSTNKLSSTPLAILLGRQHAILDSLGAPAELVVITAGWNGRVTLEGRRREVEDAAPGTLWQTILYDDSDPPYFIYWHMYVG